MSRFAALALLFLGACGSAGTAAETDALAATYGNVQKPYPERVRALVALRSAPDAARQFPGLKARLWDEVAAASSLSMSPDQEQAFVCAIGWLAEERDPAARLRMELFLDRATVKRQRLPEPALRATASGLGQYPESESARETLWAALRDPKEVETVRFACMKSLRPMYPKNFTEELSKVPAAEGDTWLRRFQR
jgi:hypothetical protein